MEYDINGNPTASDKSLEIGKRYLLEGKVTEIVKTNGKEIRRAISEFNAARWLNLRSDAQNYKACERKSR